jgi:hypothetical protein
MRPSPGLLLFSCALAACGAQPHHDTEAAPPPGPAAPAAPAPTAPSTDALVAVLRASQIELPLGNPICIGPNEEPTLGALVIAQSDALAAGGTLTSSSECRPGEHGGWFCTTRFVGTADGNELGALKVEYQLDLAGQHIDEDYLDCPEIF